jgi:hypothetical protein
MNTPGETVQAAQRLLAERERVGLAKYGTTVDRTDLQAGDWLQHAIEEASDLLLYLIRLRDTIPRVTFHPRPGPLDSDPAEAERNMRAKEDADRAARIARWANAPAEAKWLTEDPDGACYFHEGRPFQSHPSRPWYSKGWTAAGENLLGRVACEPRPQAAVDPERAAYLKRWEAAPEWAQWLSENAGGWCRWHAHAPFLTGFAWRITGMNQAAGNRMLGSISCEPRPELQP